MPRVLSMSALEPLLLLLLAVMGVPVAGLRDVQVSVPEAAAAGDTVSLQCRYDLEQDVLYSVKWYKGREEFFRYIPKELPHTRVFPLPGFDVDVGRSGPGVVVLRSVSPVMSGRFRCEVSADAPSFHTAMKTSYMHVVELPESAPAITAEKTRVSPGDTLRVHCTAPPAHPPANLTWLLNNVLVKGTPTDLEPPAPTPGEHSYSPASRNVTRLFGQINAESGHEPAEENIGYLRRGHRNFDMVGIHPQNTQQEARYQKRNVEEKFQRRVTEERLHNQGDSSEQRVKRKTTVQKPFININEAFQKREKTEDRIYNPGDLLEDATRKSVFETKAVKQEAVVKKSSGSSLVLPISQESFLQGRMTVTCRATVFSLYNAQAHLILEGEKPQIASVLGTRESSSGVRNVPATEMLYLLLYFLVLHWCRPN